MGKLKHKFNFDHKFEVTANIFFFLIGAGCFEANTAPKNPYFNRKALNQI